MKQYVSTNFKLDLLFFKKKNVVLNDEWWKPDESDNKINQ